MTKYLLCALLYALILVACSSTDIAGGATDTESGGVIVGVAFTESGQSVPQAIVKLIPSDYIPGNGVIVTTTSDENGVYRFTTLTSGEYNLSLSSTSQEIRTLRKGITIQKDSELNLTDTLHKTSELHLILPDTISPLGQFYIKGTDIEGSVTDATLAQDSSRILKMPHCYQGDNFSLVYRNVEEVVLLPQVITVDTSTVKVDLTTENLITYWKFPLLVGVSISTANKYGGFDSVSQMIENQIDSVERWFNSDNLFNGVYMFPIDSMYLIDGSVDDEYVATPEQFAFRVIYDVDNEATFGNWENEKRIIRFNFPSDMGDGLFGHTSFTQGTMTLFSLARGAEQLYPMRVSAENNPISHQAFSPPASILNRSSELVWDSYNLSIMNHSDRHFSILPRIALQAFPKSIGIRVNQGGIPQKEAALKIYPVSPTGLVDTSAVQTVLTDAEGVFYFSANPFVNSEKNEFTTLNFLIASQVNQSQQYKWLPFYEISNHWFTDSTTPYIAEIEHPE